MKRKLIGAGGLAIAAIGVLISSAFAHPPYDVEVGGSTATADHLFFGTSTPAGIDFSVDHLGTITNMDCGDVNVEGKVHAGLNRNNPIATIMPVTRVNTPETFHGLDWKNCRGPAGLAMTVQPTLNWELRASGPATAANTDVIAGQITGAGGGLLTARVYATAAPGACDFTVSGVADGSFDEATQALTVNETGYTGNLTITSIGSGGAANCFGLVGVGDSADFQGVFDIGADAVGNDKDEITVPLPVYLSE
ncbi:hypothetical protein ACLM5J_13300 [Nocardioides sp. Bht2]|uniref:hypothetical protein n=1 Tax=Nocardioides sp. Bht2 TaxID=3392297 RepID=UPI0039B467F7